MTERELAQSIAHELVSRETDILYVQVATGAVAGLGLPTERTIDRGDVVRVDVAATYKGYVSDLGRSFAVGTSSPEKQELYQVARRALEAGIAAAQLGQAVNDIFESSMAVWADAGCAHVKRHHTGHGLGLQAHEAPMIKPGNTDILQAGIVLAVEVPYYVQGLGGFAPEDVIVLSDEGSTRLTHAPAELPVIG